MGRGRGSETRGSGGESLDKEMDSTPEIHAPRNPRRTRFPRMYGNQPRSKSPRNHRSTSKHSHRTPTSGSRNRSYPETSSTYNEKQTQQRRAVITSLALTRPHQTSLALTRHMITLFYMLSSVNFYLQSILTATPLVYRAELASWGGRNPQHFFICYHPSIFTAQPIALSRWGAQPPWYIERSWRRWGRNPPGVVGGRNPPGISSVAGVVGGRNPPGVVGGRNPPGVVGGRNPPGVVGGATPP